MEQLHSAKPGEEILVPLTSAPGRGGDRGVFDYVHVYNDMHLHHDRRVPGRKRVSETSQTDSCVSRVPQQQGTTLPQSTAKLRNPRQKTAMEGARGNLYP